MSARTVPPFLARPSCPRGSTRCPAPVTSSAGFAARCPPPRRSASRRTRCQRSRASRRHPVLLRVATAHLLEGLLEHVDLISTVALDARHVPLGQIRLADLGVPGGGEGGDGLRVAPGGPSAPAPGRNGRGCNSSRASTTVSNSLTAASKPSSSIEVSPPGSDGGPPPGRSGRPEITVALRRRRRLRKETARAATATGQPDVPMSLLFECPAAAPTCTPDPSVSRASTHADVDKEEGRDPPAPSFRTQPRATRASHVTTPAGAANWFGR